MGASVIQWVGTLKPGDRVQWLGRNSNSETVGSIPWQAETIFIVWKHENTAHKGGGGGDKKTKAGYRCTMAARFPRGK